MKYKTLRNKIELFLKKHKHKSKKYKEGDWVEYSGTHFDEQEYLAIFDTLLEKYEETGKAWMVLGDKTKEFENKFSPLLGKNHGTFTNSGSSANLLMVSALTSANKRNKWKLNKGDRVITPIVCFPTTLNPILQNGLEPVFVDVDLPSLNISLDKVEEVLTTWDTAIQGPLPKAIMFAHVLGNPPDMERLMSICEEYNLIFLEDACDALGSTYDSKPLGSFGLMSTCSFYPAHHMTTGEGGMVCTNEYRLKTTLNSFRDWGRACYCNELKPGRVTCGTACGCRFSNWFPEMNDVEYDHRYVFDEIGYNLKPLELQASIGLAQINKLPEMEKARRDNHKRLTEIFSKYTDFLTLQTATDKADPCWFGFLVLMEEEKKKKKLVSFLEKNKIQTRSYFSGNILYHPGYKHLTNKTSEELVKEFPNAHIATTSVFFLGTFIGLTKEKLDYVEKVVDDFFLMDKQLELF